GRGRLRSYRSLAALGEASPAPLRGGASRCVVVEVPPSSRTGVPRSSGPPPHRTGAPVTCQRSLGSHRAGDGQAPVPASLFRSSARSSAPPCRFFFQAEDGIRGGHVTGVQTCALPI